jgi:hypothetical protein
MKIKYPMSVSKRDAKGKTAFGPNEKPEPRWGR